MGRAEDLFGRLEKDGERAIDDLVSEQQFEELFLDFKRSADGGRGTKLHQNDRLNLAKAISGFGNSEGGVVIWGVECSKTADQGDVASAKVPIENPKRYASWLEGAISACTIPPHPSVRNLAVETATSGFGFVATLIPKSYLAPHQCVKPVQYYIRAGSDFVPTPHAVLAGLFGRRPQAFVFHMWSIPEAKLARKAATVLAVEFEVGLLLGSHGPGLARDLYVNAKIFPPDKPSMAWVKVGDHTNWTGSHAFGVMTSLVSVDSFKLAPESLVQPLILSFSLAPPFEGPLSYEITYGHGSSPITKIEARVEPDALQHAYDEFVKAEGKGEWARRFIRDVLSITDPGLDRSTAEAVPFPRAVIPRV